MGLTTWADAPNGKIKKTDVTVAKNYLSEFAMRQLERMVSAYLDFDDKLFMSDYDKFLLELEEQIKQDTER